MIAWDSQPCTEPPLTMDLSVDSIMQYISSPLILPPYPNHTQSVERMVRVVCEVAGKRVGYLARHRYALYQKKLLFTLCFRQILQKLESRSLVPQFNTKKDDATF